MESKKIPITFVTGNKKKLEEFLSIMSDELANIYHVTNIELDCNLFYFTYIYMDYSG